MKKTPSRARQSTKTDEEAALGTWPPLQNLTHPQEGINNYKFISKAKPFDTHTEERDVLLQYIYTHTWSIILETHGEQC